MVSEPDEIRGFERWVIIPRVHSYAHMTDLAGDVNRYIARSFKLAMEEQLEENPNENINENIRPSNSPSYLEKFERWNVDSSETPEAAPDILEDDNNEGELSSTEYSQSFMDHQVFLETSQEYQWLLAKIRADAMSINQDVGVLSAVRSRLREVLDQPWKNQNNSRGSKQSLQVVFTLHVRIRDFFDYYYRDLDSSDLCSVVALTGSVTNAQATTCDQYLKQMWSQEAVETLKAIERAMSRGSSSGKARLAISFRRTNNLQDSFETEPSFPAKSLATRCDLL